MKLEDWKAEFCKALDEDLANPDGYWNTLENQGKQEQLRYDKFEVWLKTNDFDTVLQESLKKNRESLFRFVCDYVSDRLEIVNNELIPDDFSQGTWFFKGYWFQLLCGQGCIWKIYNADLECLKIV